VSAAVFTSRSNRSLNRTARRRADQLLADSGHSQPLRRRPKRTELLDHATINVPDLGRADQLILGILASDRGRLKDIARLQPSPTQRVEVLETVKLESALHARILASGR